MASWKRDILANKIGRFWIITESSILAIMRPRWICALPQGLCLGPPCFPHIIRGVVDNRPRARCIFQYSFSACTSSLCAPQRTLNFNPRREEIVFSTAIMITLVHTMQHSVHHTLLARGRGAPIAGTNAIAFRRSAVHFR